MNHLLIATTEKINAHDNDEQNFKEQNLVRQRDPFKTILHNLTFLSSTTMDIRHSFLQSPMPFLTECSRKESAATEKNINLMGENYYQQSQNKHGKHI